MASKRQVPRRRCNAPGPVPKERFGTARTLGVDPSVRRPLALLGHIKERTVADQTIRIPADQVDAARRSLMHVYSGIAEALHHASAEMAVGDTSVDNTHGHRVELADAEDALDQIGWTEATSDGPIELTAHPELLSDVLVQMVHEALEALEIAIDSIARGTGEIALTRIAVNHLLVRFKLFERVHGL